MMAMREVLTSYYTYLLILSCSMFDRLKITDRKNDPNQRGLQAIRWIDWLYENGSNLY